MKNILLISALFPPEPVVSAMLSKDIAQSLSKENNVVVLCPQPSRPEGYNFESLEEPKDYKLIRLNSFLSPASKIIGRFKESYSFGKHCAEYIQKNAKDINCIYINSWPLASQYLIIKTAKKFGVPCILHIQDIYPESLIGKLPAFLRVFFYKLLLPIDKYILQNASKILGISENMIMYLSKTRKVNRARFELVRNWQNDQIFLHFIPAKNDSSDFTFMYVGSISASAGVENLIYGFDKAALNKGRLLIVGNGAEKNNCIRIAKELNNQDVEFLEVTPAEVPSIQSKADVLLLPLKKRISLTATPSKLTAYLYSAKPVIASVEEESDVAKILKLADCGFIVQPEDADSLALAMKNTFGIEKRKLLEMGQRGREYAISNLSKEANLKKVVHIIQDSI